MEAARLGAIFGRDQKAYDRWRADRPRPAARQSGLVGKALEGHVMSLAITAKRLVALPGETPRRLGRA